MAERVLWRTRFVAVAILLGASSVFAQHTEPFAAYAQSLANKADALLASDEEGQKGEECRTSGDSASGAKARFLSEASMARLKSCPDTSCLPSHPARVCPERSCLPSASCDTVLRYADLVYGLTAAASLRGSSSLHWASGGLGSTAARVDLLRPAIEPILASRGVPADVAVAVMQVESGGRADALSPKGARGLWQLMPNTARRYGLRVDEAQDERLNMAKATDAAAAYLHDLYAQFGDWKLALAAYNAGEAHVSSAILRAHSMDFDRLAGMGALPQETRDYVPRVLARANLVPLQSSGAPRRASAAAPSQSGATVFAVSFQ